MKTDADLGAKIHAVLKEKGLETPIVNFSGVMDEEPVESKIESMQAGIMEALGLDLRDDSLHESPRRVAELYVQELFTGLDYRNFPKCTTVDNKMAYREMLIRSGIDVKSMCEHHFLPIVGRATVAYLPSTKVIGLSKLDRIVNFFARRPQVQERMTEQIAEALKVILETENVAVIISCRHFCISHRGVQGSCSDTISSRLHGKFFTESTLRSEFLTLTTNAPPSF